MIAHQSLHIIEFKFISLGVSKISKNERKKKGKGRDFKGEILNFIKNNPAGVTITDIADGINSSRNTVSKYIIYLETDGEVNYKKLGPYNLYFSVERSHIPKRMIMMHYDGLLNGIKKKLSSIQDYKELGHSVAENMYLPYGSKIPDEILPHKRGNKKRFLKYFGNVFPYIDFIYDSVVDIDIEINEEGSEVVYRLNNIEFESYENIEVHFYIESGVIEKYLTKILKTEAQCNVDTIDKDNKFVELSVQFI